MQGLLEQVGLRIPRPLQLPLVRHRAFAELRTALAPSDIAVVVEVDVRMLSQPVPRLGTLDVSNVHVVTSLSLEPLAWL